MKSKSVQIEGRMEENGGRMHEWMNEWKDMKMQIENHDGQEEKSEVSSFFSFVKPCIAN